MWWLGLAVVDGRVGFRASRIRLPGRARGKHWRFVFNGTSPVTAIVVKVERIYFQCARALKRSRLWDPKSHADPHTLPSAGTLIRSAIAEFDATAYDAELQERQANTLY